MGTFYSTERKRRYSDSRPQGGGADRCANLLGVDCLVTGRATPVRTCVGCRARAAKSDLLRVVVVEGACVPDQHGRLPGRGAHLHPDSACLDLAERRRAFPRALRVPGPLDLSALREYVGRGPSH